MNPRDLENEYQTHIHNAENLRRTLVQELSKLFERNHLTLGVPLEGRVKTISSILEKKERKESDINSVLDFDDFIGIRAIFLFARDVIEAKKLIETTFKIISSEDTSVRLSEGQFGYQSQHYVLQLPDTWLEVPSHMDIGTLRAEVQVRTLAQHIWAAASHKLQYKREDNVPPPVRRAIHRVSALLETVDLEFERVLDARKTYEKTDLVHLDSKQILDVDVLKAVLTEVIPEKNRGEEERYAELLKNLLELGINTVEKLNHLLKKHYDNVAQAEMQRVQEKSQDENISELLAQRLKRGVFFSHVGWVRNALRQELGNEKVDNAMGLKENPPKQR